MGCLLKQLVMRMKRQHGLHLYSLMARQCNLNWTLVQKLQFFSCNTFKTLGCQELKTSSKILYGPGKQPLDVMGQFLAKIAYKNAHSQEPIFVVRGLNSNLLGLPALTCRALQLVARTDAISQCEEQISTLIHWIGNTRTGVHYQVNG